MFYSGLGNFGDIDDANVVGSQVGLGTIINSRSGANSPVFRGRESSNTTYTSEIFANGSATFAGAMKIQPSGSSEINDNNAFAINYSDGTPKVTMTGNGRITAAKGYALAQLPALP